MQVIYIELNGWFLLRINFTNKIIKNQIYENTDVFLEK